MTEKAADDVSRSVEECCQQLEQINYHAAQGLASTATCVVEGRDQRAEAEKRCGYSVECMCGSALSAYCVTLKI